MLLGNETGIIPRMDETKDGKNTADAAFRRTTEDRASGARIGFVGLLVEDRDTAAPAVNRVLSEAAPVIRARLGIPGCGDHPVSVITLVVEATTDQLGRLSGALGRIPGVSVRSALSKI